MSKQAKTERRRRARERAWAASANEKMARKAERKLSQEHKADAIRAKYGPLGAPAPVVVKRFDTGEVQTRKQSAITGKVPSLLGDTKEAAQLREDKRRRAERASAARQRTRLEVGGPAPEIVTPLKRKMGAAEAKEFRAAVKEAERARRMTGRLHYVFKSHCFDSAGDPYADPYADLTDKATWDVRPL